MRRSSLNRARLIDDTSDSSFNPCDQRGGYDELHTLSNRLKELQDQQKHCLRSCLLKIHNSIVSLDVAFQKDVLVLQHLYQTKFYKPLTKLRFMILNTVSRNERSPSLREFVNQVQKTVLPSDNNDFLTKCELLISAAPHLNCDTYAGNFWLNVMLHSDGCVQQLMRQCDDDVIKYLLDVTCTSVTTEAGAAEMFGYQGQPDDADLGFHVIFRFAANPFFHNREIVKRYRVNAYIDHEANQEAANDEKAMTYSGPAVVAINGTKIDWKVNRVKQESISKDRIFSLLEFFEYSWDAQNDDSTPKAQQDYNIGTYMRDVMIPKAFALFRSDFTNNGPPEDVQKEEEYQNLFGGVDQRVGNLISKRMTREGGDATEDASGDLDDLSDMTDLLEKLGAVIRSKAKVKRRRNPHPSSRANRQVANQQLSTDQRPGPSHTFIQPAAVRNVRRCPTPSSPRRVQNGHPRSAREPDPGAKAEAFPKPPPHKELRARRRLAMSDDSASVDAVAASTAAVSCLTDNQQPSSSCSDDYASALTIKSPASHVTNPLRIDLTRCRSSSGSERVMPTPRAAPVVAGSSEEGSGEFRTASDGLVPRFSATTTTALTQFHSAQEEQIPAAVPPPPVAPPAEPRRRRKLYPSLYYHAKRRSALYNPPHTRQAESSSSSSSDDDPTPPQPPSKPILYLRRQEDYDRFDQKVYYPPQDIVYDESNPGPSARCSWQHRRDSSPRSGASALVFSERGSKRRRSSADDELTPKAGKSTATSSSYSTAYTRKRKSVGVGGSYRSSSSKTKRALRNRACAGSKYRHAKVSCSSSGVSYPDAYQSFRASYRRDTEDEILVSSCDNEDCFRYKRRCGMRNRN